eukprot:s1334_g9.t1
MLVLRLNGVLAQSPLHQVISGCDEDTSLLTKLLKDRPEIDPSVADANGWTALHLCCDMGKASALRLLLAQVKMLHVAHGSESGKENRPKSLRSKELPSETLKLGITRSSGRTWLERPSKQKQMAVACPAAFFLTYLTLVVFAVIRVVTALFIKETLASAANDADMVMEDKRRADVETNAKLEELFLAADENQDGILSPGEFLAAMNLPSVKNFLHSMDVNIRDIGPLFEILDDGDGMITVSEFCKGLQQLKGSARAIDMVVLQHENARVLKETQSCRQDVQRLTNLVQVSRSQRKTAREKSFMGYAVDPDAQESSFQT